MGQYKKKPWPRVFSSSIYLLRWMAEKKLYVGRYRVYLGILSRKFLLRQHDNENLIVAAMTTIKILDKIKQKRRHLMLQLYLRRHGATNIQNVFKVQIRGISSIKILKWTRNEKLKKPEKREFLVLVQPILIYNVIFRQIFCSTGRPVEFY